MVFPSVYDEIFWSDNLYATQSMFIEHYAKTYKHLHDHKLWINFFI